MDDVDDNRPKRKILTIRVSAPDEEIPEKTLTRKQKRNARTAFRRARAKARREAQVLA